MHEAMYVYLAAKIGDLKTVQRVNYINHINTTITYITAIKSTLEIIFHHCWFIVQSMLQ